MLTELLMPWWAWAYLCLVVVMFLTGLVSAEKRPHEETIGSLMSLSTICISVLSFFNAHVLGFFGYFLIPMVVIGLTWEFVQAIKDTEGAKEELSNQSDLSEGERSALLNVAVGFNALVIVPGYMMGAMTCLQMINGG